MFFKVDDISSRPAFSRLLEATLDTGSGLFVLKIQVASFESWRCIAALDTSGKRGNVRLG